MPRFIVKPARGHEWVRYCDDCAGKQFPAACDAAASCGKCATCRKQTADTEHHRCVGCAITNSECEACGKKLPSKTRPVDDLPNDLKELYTQVSLEQTRALKNALLGKRDEAKANADRARRIGLKAVRLARAQIATQLDSLNSLLSANLPNTAAETLKAAPTGADNLVEVSAMLKSILRLVQHAAESANAQRPDGQEGLPPRRRHTKPKK